MGGRRSRHIHTHCQRQRPIHVHAPVSQTLEPSNSHLTCGLSDAIFGRDGRLVKLSESVPFVGFLMAAFHQAKNDGVRILISLLHTCRNLLPIFHRTEKCEHWHCAHIVPFFWSLDCAAWLAAPLAQLSQLQSLHHSQYHWRGGL